MRDLARREVAQSLDERVDGLAELRFDRGLGGGELLVGDEDAPVAEVGLIELLGKLE